MTFLEIHNQSKRLVVLLCVLVFLSSCSSLTEKYSAVTKLSSYQQAIHFFISREQLKNKVMEKINRDSSGIHRSDYTSLVDKHGYIFENQHVVPRTIQTLASKKWYEAFVSDSTEIELFQILKDNKESTVILGGQYIYEIGSNGKSECDLVTYRLDRVVRIFPPRKSQVAQYNNAGELAVDLVVFGYNSMMTIQELLRT